MVRPWRGAPPSPPADDRRAARPNRRSSDVRWSEADWTLASDVDEDDFLETEAFRDDAFDPDEPEDDGRLRRPSLAGLSIAGITRRRSAFALGAVVTLWIVIVFARQVGDASAATARADAIRSQNAALAADVAALQSEVQLIGRQPYIEQQARGYALGTTRERPFALAPGAPSLAPDAPGSAAVRLGAGPPPRSPLETWLSLLFGPSGR